MGRRDGTYLVGVVEGEDAAARLVDVLVAVLGAAHGQGGVHVDVVARQVERDEALEDDGPAREGGRQEHQQAGGGAAVRHHVEDGAEARRLLKVAGGVAVEGVEQAGHAVEERAGARVQRHVVERGEGEDDARVAWRGWVSMGAGRGLDMPLVVPMMLGHSKNMFSLVSSSSSSSSTALAVSWVLALPLAACAISSSLPWGSAEAAAAPWRRFFAPAILVHSSNHPRMQDLISSRPKPPGSDILGAGVWWCDAEGSG